MFKYKIISFVLIHFYKLNMVCVCSITGCLALPTDLFDRCFDKLQSFLAEFYIFLSV